MIKKNKQLKKIKRNEEIIRLHNEGITYEKLAKKYNVSKSRIGQICSPKEEFYYYCEKHDKRFKTKCPICEIDEKYGDELDDSFNLMKEIDYLKIPNRKDYIVRKRKILVTKLIDEKLFSISQVADLLDMDRASIIHLYESYKGQK